MEFRISARCPGTVLAFCSCRPSGAKVSKDDTQIVIISRSVSEERDEKVGCWQGQKSCNRGIPPVATLLLRSWDLIVRASSARFFETGTSAAKNVILPHGSALPPKLNHGGGRGLGSPARIPRGQPARPRARGEGPAKKHFRKMHFSKILQIFGGLVLGCIKTKFCKKICV